MLNHRYRDCIVWLVNLAGIAAILKDTRDSKGSRVVKLLETLVIDIFRTISIRVHCDVIRIFIYSFDLFHNLRVNLWFNNMRWRIRSVWRLKFTDSCDLSVVRLTKSVKTMAVRCCFIAYWNLLRYLFKKWNFIDIRRPIEKVRTYLYVKSLVAGLLLKWFLWSNIRWRFSIEYSFFWINGAHHVFGWLLTLGGLTAQVWFLRLNMIGWDLVYNQASSYLRLSLISRWLVFSVRLDLLGWARFKSIFEIMFFLNEKISYFVGPTNKLLVMTGRSPGTLYLISNIIIVLRVDD